SFVRSSVASVHSYRAASVPVSWLNRKRLWSFVHVMVVKGRVFASYGFLCSVASCAASFAWSNRGFFTFRAGTTSMNRVPSWSFQLYHIESVLPIQCGARVVV